ncbi:GNAT family N-acetyltransferase [Brucella pituitosa]|uniref:GNAT family N-acetyltransferase n=1 Tax=Brucella pituitosa TaxID=571256 RepID=A0A643EWX9_9HYPH|nr:MULTISPECIES: GNAT family N-acetyltransferase [Brucella]KAB0569347.1 GNAT family N-acetyltransferase [Brucella pituitosa]MBO1041138.1 GNAT family N-acetyltransferase [Brucella pituitosa]MCK4204897.1 GNAT family N-acetyltransferase [Brucella pituitosa]
MTERTKPVSNNIDTRFSEAIKIRAVEPTDETSWKKLYRGYAAFYKVPMDEDILKRTWAWLQDSTHPLEGLVAESGENVIGFAHYWPQPRPLQGQDAGFLDDLFVDPSYRGRGVGRLLIEALSDIAHIRNWTMLSWVTAQDNVTARRLYDDVATAANWVTYERVF